MREFSKDWVGEPVRKVPGLAWFLMRESEPAWKWQVAQAMALSLESWVSQKKALPRAMAAARFLTKLVRVVGSGTGTLLRDWSWRARTRTVRLAFARRPAESTARAVKM